MASSKRRGELTEMIVVMPGSSRNWSSVSAARDRHHRDAVERPAPADRRDMERLVGQRQIGEVGVEMARIRRHFDRRADLVAEHVDAIEMLRQPDEVLVVAQVSGAPPALHVVHVGRPGDEREVDRVAAEMDRVDRVARGQRVGRRRGLQRLGHQPAVEPHGLRRVIDLGACLLEQRQRARAHRLDAEIFQNVQRGLVDRLDLVGREHRHRRIGIAHPTQRQLRDCRRTSVACALGAAFASRFVHLAIFSGRAAGSAGCVSASMRAACRLP